MTKLQAALDYAALGWPVVPGAIWHEGQFADPVDERPVTNPCPPSALDTTGAIWLVTPGQAGGVLMAGDELADLIRAGGVRGQW